jgi:hypothetical protein
MEAGKRVPLTPSDIANETGLHKQNVRPALRELDAAGLVEIKGSTKGAIEIYAYPVPKPVKTPENGNSRHYHFDGLPAQVICLLRKFRTILQIDFRVTPEYIRGVEDAARHYQEAEMVLKRALKGNVALPPIYKEERNESNIERNKSVCLSKEGDTPEAPTDRPAPENLNRTPETEASVVTAMSLSQGDRERTEPFAEAARLPIIEVMKADVAHKSRQTSRNCSNPLPKLKTPLPPPAARHLENTGRNTLAVLEARIEARWDKIPTWYGDVAGG